MSTPQLERLRTHCQRLRLHQLAVEISTLLEQAAKKELSYADFLDELLRCEEGWSASSPCSSRAGPSRWCGRKRTRT